jgi:hypothetical protein
MFAPMLAGYLSLTQTSEGALIRNPGAGVSQYSSVFG